MRTANRAPQVRPLYQDNGDRNSRKGSASGAGEAVREYVSDAGEKLAASASSLASSATDYADEARRTISETSGQVAQRAQSTVQDTIDRVTQQQPLTLALLGLAAGAAVAAVLPPSEIERETLGAAGERLAESAEKVGESLKDSTAKAGERIKSAAEDSLKDVASDVAGAVGSALSREQKQESQATSWKPSGSALAPDDQGFAGVSGRSQSDPRLGSGLSGQNLANNDRSNDPGRSARPGRSTGKRSSS
jgi:hypothetical protein